MTSFKKVRKEKFIGGVQIAKIGWIGGNCCATNLKPKERNPG
jgi:hypothetical protein